MSRNKRIVFMGTPQFAVETLKIIHNSIYEVVAVVCPPDRPAGRGQKLKSCDVKEFALNQKLAVLQPEKLKCPDFIAALKKYDADLFVVVAFRMLPREVWSIPKYGTINIHGSILPNYRGAAPINRAIMNGETKTGVTSFFINESIDTGDTLMKKECDITLEDNFGTVHNKLMVLGAKLALETCDAIFNKNIIAKKQVSHKNLLEAPKLFKEDCRIDWTKRSSKIHNHIRGLSPYPGAWTKISHKDITSTAKIFKSEFCISEHNMPTGTIAFTKKTMTIFTSDGYLSILEIQTSGKKRMPISAFLNGIDINSNMVAL